MNLVQYSSNHQPKIYQTDPVYSKPSQFKAKGWTDSTLGYINEAKQWAMCIVQNRQMMKRPYTWAVHINLNEELPAKDIGPMWDKGKRKLKERGIVCLWVREPNSLNKVHYHIIVKNHISQKELKNAIDRQRTHPTGCSTRHPSGKSGWTRYAASVNGSMAVGRPTRLPSN